MPFDQAHKQYETARHLPPPLYVLFVQASAYGQACGEHRGESAVLSNAVRGCHQLGLGGNAPPTSCISLKALLQGCFGRSFSAHLLCCWNLLRSEQWGGPTARHNEAAAFETLFAQLPRWKNCLGSSLPISAPLLKGGRDIPAACELAQC